MEFVSLCVQEVAVRRFCVAKLPRPETCLRPYYTRGAHAYLVTLSNHYKGLVGLSMPEAYDFEAAIVHPDRVC